jgi:hypothetical protein
VLKINERLGIPKFKPQLFACYDLAWFLQQRNQNLERLFLKLNFDSGFAKLAGLEIHLKKTETEGLNDRGGIFHGEFLNPGATLAHTKLTVNRLGQWKDRRKSSAYSCLPVERQLRSVALTPRPRRSKVSRIQFVNQK